MGGNQSQLTEDELQDYKDLTYLSRKEILHAFGRFRDLDLKEVNSDRHVRLPASTIKRMTELKNNPFADRLCEVYSSRNDGCLSFEDFLDMISVFSDNAPPQKKAAYAFKIYDFDNDGFLNRDDLQELIRRLTKLGSRVSPDDPLEAKVKPLTEDECEQLIKRVFQEADLDKDEQISPMEFEHVVLKSPDFASSFKLKL